MGKTFRTSRPANAAERQAKENTQRPQYRNLKRLLNRLTRREATRELSQEVAS